MTIAPQRFLSILLGTILALALFFMCTGEGLQAHASPAHPAIPKCVQPCSNSFYGSNQSWMQTATSDWYEHQTSWCGIANIRAIQRYDWLYYNGGTPQWDNSQESIFSRLNSNTSPWGAGGGGVQADISRDFGTDPRALAYGAWYDTPTSNNSQQYWFHNWIYKTDALTATADFSSDFGTNTLSHNDPISVTVDGGYHSFIVDGVFANSDPSQGGAVIRSIDTWDPWLNSSNNAPPNYSKTYNQTQNQVWSIYDWTHTNTMWGQPYDNGNNTGSDPEPDTANHYYVPPFSGYSHHWNTYYVTIEQDRINDAVTSHDYAIDENGHLAPHN